MTDGFTYFVLILIVAFLFVIAKLAKKFKYFVLILIGLFVFLAALPYIDSFIRYYSKRFQECDPYPLISTLEKISGTDFSDDIRHIKAAKTIPIEGDSLFILKFIDEPDDVNNFLESFLRSEEFPDENPIISTYHFESDLRKNHFWLHPPKWFRENIRQGITAKRSDIQYQNAEVYVDTSNEGFFIVYIKGNYRATHEEKHPMRVSHSGLLYLTTEINKYDDYQYPCVKVIIKDNQGKLIQEIQTNASDWISWRIGWGRKDTIILNSSDIGELRWKRQENNKWVLY